MQLLASSRLPTARRPSSYPRSPARRVGSHAGASLVVAFVLLASACATTAPFSQVAYEQATSLKARSLSLMAKATEPYASHAADAEALRLDVEKAYDYAKGRPKNDMSTRQWALLLDPSGNLLGGFLARWKAESTLTPTFIDEDKRIVGDAFDTIIALESGKPKPSDGR